MNDLAAGSTRTLLLTVGRTTSSLGAGWAAPVTQRSCGCARGCGPWRGGLAGWSSVGSGGWVGLG